MVSDARIIKISLALFLLAWGIYGWSLGPDAHYAGRTGYLIHVAQTFLGLFILGHEFKLKKRCR